MDLEAAKDSPEKDAPPEASKKEAEKTPEKDTAEKDVAEKVRMGAIVGTLFKIRDQAHVLHLSTKSFAQHVALGDFYDDLLELIDELAETYQGVYSKIDVDFGSEFSAPSDAVEFIQMVSGFVNGLVDKPWSPGYSHLDNIWDEIKAIVDRTKYKLENLK